MSAAKTVFKRGATSSTGSIPRLIAFPKSGIAYTICAYTAAESSGITVIHGLWSGRWLMANVRRDDVLHIHWPSFLYFDAESTFETYKGLLRYILFLQLMRWRGARIIWTAHNLYPHDGGRALLCHRIARRAIVRYADYILAHGETAAGIVAREFGIPKSKMRVIKHGNWIDHHPRTLSPAEARRQLGIAPDRFVYSFVGLCKPYKNLELLIEKFAQLDGEPVLVVAGHFQSEEYRARIQSLLERLPRDRWRLECRFIPNDEIQRYVLAGDVLVVPYSTVLTSGSAMLGLSLGRPVIAPESGGLPDMVNSNCGLLYDASKPDNLSAALTAIKEKKFSEAAIIEHARSFDWTQTARVLGRLLGDAVPGHAAYPSADSLDHGHQGKAE